MKVKSKEFYSALFIIIILLQLYLPSFKANVLFQVFIGFKREKTEDP